MSDRLPADVVDSLFRRFREVWGAQKVRSMLAPPEGEAATDWAEDVGNVWAVQLGAFGPATLRAAMQAAVDSDREWPPNLSEFKGLCRQFNRPEHSAPALPAPRSEPTREALEAIRVAGGLKGRAADPLFWAKRPASDVAVRLLVEGARNDHRLRSILRAHLAEPHVRENHPRADGALAALRALAQNPPEFLAQREPA